MRSYENNKVTTANKAMKTLELRFGSDSGDAKYRYTNILVDVTSTGGKDKETFVLSKTGSYYSYTFPLDNTPSPTINNGTVEIADSDTLGATFRNTETPQLPLDTLNISIPYNASSGINANLSPSTKSFRFYISKTGNGEPVIFLQNMPVAGEIDIYTVRGQCVFTKKLARGYAVLRFPELESSALYLVALKYGSAIMNKKAIIP